MKCKIWGIVYFIFMNVIFVNAQREFSTWPDINTYPLNKAATEIMYVSKTTHGYEFLLIDSASNKFSYITKNTSGLFFFSSGQIFKSSNKMYVELKGSEYYNLRGRGKIKKNRDLYRVKNIRFLVSSFWDDRILVSNLTDGDSVLNN